MDRLNNNNNSVAGGESDRRKEISQSGEFGRERGGTLTARNEIQRNSDKGKYMQDEGNRRGEGKEEEGRRKRKRKKKKD